MLWRSLEHRTGSRPPTFARAQVLYVTAAKLYECERSDYLVRFSFTRFSVRMIMVSCRYFIRGETACKNITSTGWNTSSAAAAPLEKAEDLRRHC